jgi:Fur family transcriptional regulator, peroxide stress response regulator
MNRRSRQKEAIISVLRNTSSHPTAEWIYEQVRKEIPNIGLATVYRNLRLLNETGELSEIRTSHHRTRFDANTDMHYHFCCDSCGRILDLDEPIDRTVEARITERTGLKVTRHYLELGGLCQDCQKREAQAATSTEGQ